MLFVTDSV